jgi:hypothetical protein
MAAKKGDKILGLVLACLAMTVVHCGGTTSLLSTSTSEDDSDDNADTTSEVIAGNVQSLSLQSGDNSISLEGLSEDDDVLLVLYNYSDDDDSVSFELSGSESSSYLVSGSDNSESDYDEDESDITEAFHLILREQENAIDDADMVQQSSVSYLRYSTIGSTKSFKVVNSYSSSESYDNVTATLKYATDDFEFYVDNRNLDDIDEDDLEELAENFQVDDMHGLYGEESDVDGDGKFAVLFTQTVNELGGNSGGFVTGFFYAIDLFSSSVYEASNEQEVFYTLVPDSTGEYGSSISKSFLMSNIYPSVLHHEFQHMISFNQHYFENEGSSEESWLNEGLSHLAEDIFSIADNDYMESTGNENPSRVNSYLENIQNICFSCGSSISQRGGSYLFLRYLYEQAELGAIDTLTDGAEMIGNLLDTDLRGMDNMIQAIYGNDGSAEELKQVLGYFALATYFSNSGVTNDSRFNFSGIDLRGLQDDGRSTQLNGPAIQSVDSLNFTDTIQGTSVSYISIPASELLNNDGVLEINVDSDANMGAYLVYE